MIGILVDQLEFGGTQALGKKIMSQIVVVHVLVTYTLAFFCLFPHTRKKLQIIIIIIFLSELHYWKF